MSKQLIVTVGLPRAGKSTWTKNRSYPVVNPDSVRLAMYGRRYEPCAEKLVWATVDLMVRALFIAGHDVVVLDATNVQRWQRDAWKSTMWDTYFRVFDTPVAVCLQRAEMASDDEIIEVIKAMADKIEPLDNDEKLWPW